ncbi:MAG: SH3 domain-containing protein [Nitrospirales bacterium]|nr:SH3 domain-containing protein [Nitrospirales bacterium]
MTTSTIGAAFSTEQPSRWNVLFAQEPDKDLEFDEGLEEDDLNQSKPPSRKPLLWIALLLLIVGMAYWTLNPNTFLPDATSDHTAATTRNQDGHQSQGGIPPPTFHENQEVSLTNTLGRSLLMGDPANTLPGPIVKPGETLTILDGAYQPTGWVYQVRTPTGKTGWISSEKLKSQIQNMEKVSAR